ncbi:fasciclin domain-containing protein [Halpernia frigidisoli]|nr:fasciclin domain-containing protein [Halpernia frigidisoli]
MTFGLANQASAQKMMTKQKTVMVGGAAMYPTKNIIENAVNSKDHTTLVAAVKAAGLVETLSGKGPFTVFAPTNAAFEKLPAGTVESVLQPENKATLTSILTYHVIARKISSKDLAAWIAKGKGKYTAKTVQGEKLTFTASGKNIYVSDMKGNKAKVTIADVNQSNGVIHVIDTVLMP